MRVHDEVVAGGEEDLAEIASATLALLCKQCVCGVSMSELRRACVFVKVGACVCLVYVCVHEEVVAGGEEDLAEIASTTLALLCAPWVCAMGGRYVLVFNRH